MDTKSGSQDVKRINAFEIWVYKRMLRISWMEKRTNFSILVMLNLKIRLAMVYKPKIIKFFFPIIKRDKSSLEKIIIEGKIEGNGSHGRTPLCWIDQINTISGYPLEKAIWSVRNREFWKEIVTNVNFGVTKIPFLENGLKKKKHYDTFRNSFYLYKKMKSIIILSWYVV